MKTITISQAVLATGLRNTVFACDPEPTRYKLNCVRVEVEPYAITFVATDGHRISVITFESPHKLTDEPFVFSVPSKQAKQLAKIYATPNRCAVNVDGAKSAVDYHNGNKKAKRIEFVDVVGRFPRWRDYVKAGKPIATMQGRRDMMASYFTPTQSVCVSLNGSATFGQSVDAPKHAFEITGKLIGCHVNGDYVLEWLESQGSDKAKINVSFLGAESPIHFACGNSIYVVMPIASER